MLANAVRGEVLSSFQGRTIKLALTFGALAEMLAALSPNGGLADLRARLQRPDGEAIAILLEALCAGGGERIGAEAWRLRPDDLHRAAGAAAEAVALAFGDA